jgi:hypothetical protein
MLSEAWAAWREYVPYAHSQRSLAFRAQHHWEGGVLARAFWGWHAGAAAQRAKRAATADALLHWRARALRGALAGWREAAGWKGRRRLQAAGAEAWRRGRVKGEAFGAWLSYEQRRAAKREAAETAANAWVARALRTAFSTWADNSALSRRAAAFSAGSRRRTLALALEAWRLGAEARRRKREVLKGAARRAEGGLVRAAWAAWRVSLGGLLGSSRRLLLWKSLET